MATTTHNAETVTLDFKRITIYDEDSGEFVKLTADELVHVDNADLLTQFLDSQPTAKRQVRRKLNETDDSGGYLLDGDGDIVNRAGSKFKLNWAATKSLPDYNYVEYYGPLKAPVA